MKSLLEISRLVAQRRIRKMEVFLPGDIADSDSKFNRFFQGMMEGRFRSDRDASMFFYNSPPSDDRYRKLKSRFKKRLLNTLFLVNREASFESDYERTYFQCRQDWALVQLLQANEAHLTASQLAAQILNQALEYRFSDVVINAARMLRERAASSGDSGQFEYFNGLATIYVQLLSSETAAESLLHQLILAVGQDPSPDEEQKSNCYTICDQLLALSERTDSPVVFYNMSRAWALRYEMEEDYDHVIMVCDHAKEHIRSNQKYFRAGGIQEFVILRMRACLQLLRFREGQESIARNLTQLNSEHAGWFQFMELYFLLCMHTHNYVHALAVFHNVSINKALKRQESDIRDKWRLFQAYLYYILERKNLNNLKGHAGLKGFKPELLAMEPLDFSREKRYYALHILLLGALFILHNRELDKARLKILELQDYGKRYLKEEGQLRFLTFIRLLYQYQRADFERRETRHLDRYLDLLQNKPLGQSHRISTLEVLRFQDIWAAKLFG
jgi:hypothetical protein